jgi:hypothetical protein
MKMSPEQKEENIAAFAALGEGNPVQYWHDPTPANPHAEWRDTDGVDWNWLHRPKPGHELQQYQIDDKAFGDWWDGERTVQNSSIEIAHDAWRKALEWERLRNIPEQTEIAAGSNPPTKWMGRLEPNTSIPYVPTRLDHLRPPRLINDPNVVDASFDIEASYGPNIHIGPDIEINVPESTLRAISAAKDNQSA